MIEMSFSDIWIALFSFWIMEMFSISHKTAEYVYYNINIKINNIILKWHNNFK